MQPAWGRVTSEADRRAWADVLVTVARELEAAAGELSVAAARHVHLQLPTLFTDAESVEENRASTEASIRTFASLVQAGADPASTDLPPATVAYAQTSVRRGDTLPVLMRSYRLAVEIALQDSLERIAVHSEGQEQLAAASQLMAAWLLGFMDVALSRAEQLYDDERARWLRSAAAAQTDTIQALLAGHEANAAHASMQLRYELERHHVAVVAWLDGEDGGDPLTNLEAAISELAEATGADRVLIQPLGRLAISAWLGRLAPFDPSLLDALRLDVERAPGVHAAIGEPAVGIAGFRSTHTEARHARRLATLARRRPGSVTRFGRVALAAMACVDVEQARAFAERELGVLGGDDDVARRLVATLRVYLEENASRSRAAKRLRIHENTVSYRVRQAEEVLGRSVDERTLELRVALALMTVLPAD